ncbi:MAG: minor capsid protein [Blautia obeum]|nr:minor capsid protein [Blautia obeum]
MEKNSAYWEKRIAENTWKTYNSLEDRNRDLIDFYMKASEKIRTQLYWFAEQMERDGVLSRTEMYDQQRLQKLEKKYREIAYTLGKQVEEVTVQNMQEGFEEVYKNIAVSMADIDYTMPNKKLMEKLMNEPWRGSCFSSRLWKNQKNLEKGLNDILRTGLQQGKSVTGIAVNLHNYVGENFNVCHRLVRTETMHYLNSATIQRYKDAGVNYVQIWAAEDERTCDTCKKFHGKIYRIDECPILPLHANCRCTIIPCFDKRLISQYEKNRGNNS